MPKTPDARFPLPQQSFTQGGVVDLLGGVVRQRPLSGEEALAELKRIAELAQKGDLDARCRYALHLLQIQMNRESTAEYSPFCAPHLKRIT